MATLKFYDDFITLSLWAAGQTGGSWHTPETWAEAGMADGNENATWLINPLYPATSRADANPLSVSNSILDVGIIKTPADVNPPDVGNEPYISAYLCTRDRFHTTYGYVEARIQMPHGQGLGGAFWMMPQGGGWPPELDITEVVGRTPNITVTTIWSNDYGSTPSNLSNFTTQSDTTTAFHYYAVDWQSDFVTWYFDGIKVFQEPTPSDFHQDFYIILSAGAGSSNPSSWMGAPDSTTVFPAGMLVDYVAVWDVSPYPGGAGGTAAGLNLNTGGGGGSTASPNGTVVFVNDGTTIADANNHKWGINTSGQVTVDGTADTTTSSTTELAYVSGKVWALKNGATSIPYITPGNGSFTDGSGNVWTIAANGDATENGSPASGGGGTSAMEYYNGTVYAQDAATGNWFTWDGTKFNGPVTAPPTTTSIPYITPGNGSFTDGSGNVWSIDSAGNADENGSPVNDGAGTGAMEYYNGTVYGQDAATGSWFTWDGTQFNPAAAPPPPTGSATSGILWDAGFGTVTSWMSHGSHQGSDPWAFGFAYGTAGTGHANGAGFSESDGYWSDPPVDGTSGTCQVVGSALALACIANTGGFKNQNGANAVCVSTIINNFIFTGGFTRIFGYYEFSAHLDNVRGFLLHWDIENYNPFGELDIDIYIDSGGTHHAIARSNGTQFAAATGIDVTKTHIYGLDWQSSTVSFYVDGVLIGQTANIYSGEVFGTYFLVDTATYEVGDGAIASLPAHAYLDYYRIYATRPTGGGSSSSGWSFKTLPTDTWTAGSNPLASATFESQNNTVVQLPSTAKIIDGSGNAYGLSNTSGGQVVANGVLDTTASNVTELAFVSGAVWRDVPSQGLWWFETTPSGPWQPTGGTSTSPLPSTADRDPANQPFTSNSVWNIGVGAGATWGVTSDADVAQLIGLTGNVLGATNGQPVYVGAPSDPLIQITCSDTVFQVPAQSVHVPITAKPSPGADRWMNFFDLSQPAKLWSYAGCVLTNGTDVTGGITATKGGLWDCLGDGVANAINSGSDYNFFAGTITDFDLTSGAIQHALRFSLGLNALKSPGSTWTASIPWPGTHEDQNGPTTYTGQIVYGSTIGIPASTTLPALTKGGTILATALQKYGAICRIGTAATSSINFYTTPTSDANSLVSDMRSDLSKIIPLLRIMRNQGPATINGGGVPIPALLPPVTPNPIYYQPKFKPAGTQGWSLFGRPVTGTNVVVTGLANAAKFEFQVDAYNASGLLSSNQISDSTTSTSVTITGVTLSSTTVAPGAPSGTVVGSIGVTATGGSFSGTLTLGGTNASQFTISSSQLLTSGSIAAGTYAISITATQTGGGSFTQPFSVTASAGGQVGPAATSSFVTVEFNTKVNKPNGTGQIVIPPEMFGIATAAGLDNNFTVIANGTFQATSRSLTIPLLRFNCNSGAGGGNIYDNTFPNGPNGTPNWSVWNNFINGIGKCVNLATTKIVIGVGFGPNGTTGGFSDADFAHAAAQVVSHLRTTVPSGGGSPVNPLYWEYLNEQGSVSSSGFNAFVDAINGVGSGYTCLGPTSANVFGQISTLINGIGSRTFIPDSHAYLFCAGSDQQPTDANMAQAIPVTGTSPGAFAGNINGTCDGHIAASTPFFWGEWNLDCNATNVQEEQSVVCALFAASNLFKCATAINRPLWGGIWEWVNDGSYGIIQNNSSIAPVGYFLSNAAQKLSGGLVSTTLNGTNAPNMAGWSTQSTTAGNFGVYLHNWGGSSRSGPVALSHLPVSGSLNSSGNGTVTVWTQSGSTATGGSVTTATVTNGVTSSITVPAMGQVIISVNSASTGSGQFSIANSQIIDPTGNVWKGNGVNLAADSQSWFQGLSAAITNTSACTPLLSTFPKTKIVRIPCYDIINAMANPANISSYITALTSKNIVCSIEYHLTSMTTPSANTSPSLSQVVNWYGAWAAFYANNPYVWWEIPNEINPYPDNDNGASFLACIKGVVGAVRAHSNQIVQIMMDFGDISGGLMGAINTDPWWSQQKNLIPNGHFYHGLSGIAGTFTGSSQSDANTWMANNVSTYKTAFTTADGTNLPVVNGEYGDSTDGSNVDPNSQVVIVAGTNLTNTPGLSGSTIWYWNSTSSTADLILGSPFDGSVLTSGGTTFKNNMF